MDKCLVVADRENWSYMSIAQALVKHNTDPDMQIDIMALKGRESEFLSVEKRYDRVLVMGWQMCQTRSMRKALDGERWLAGVHSHHSFDSDLLTTPDDDVGPPKSLVTLLRRFRRVNAVSRRLTELFLDWGVVTWYTPNGVDTDLFKPTGPLSMDGPLRVGVAYTPKHDARKGVSEFIRPACEKVGAVLVEAKARSDQHVSPENMPTWHSSYDVYVCASSSEGFSVAVLEAAACGRVVVSTRVGGSTELIHHGEDGFLVDRSVDAIAHLLRGLQENREQMREIGAAMRRKVETLWSWKVRAPAWLEFLRA